MSIWVVTPITFQFSLYIFFAICHAPHSWLAGYRAKHKIWNFNMQYLYSTEKIVK